jgi:hypothetical protein
MIINGEKPKKVTNKVPVLLKLLADLELKSDLRSEMPPGTERPLQDVQFAAFYFQTRSLAES